MEIEIFDVVEIIMTESFSLIDSFDRVSDDWICLSEFQPFYPQ